LTAVVSLSKETAISLENIGNQIVWLRGEKVLLDSDLARLYGVTTARLNEQVQRNAGRFPPDFAFRLTNQEFRALMSQIAISKHGRGGRRKSPTAFTEHGALMAASVLNSDRAVQVSVYVVRAFIRLRETLAAHKVLAKKLEELERKTETLAPKARCSDSPDAREIQRSDRGAATADGLTADELSSHRLYQAEVA
jgi:ORF6N domain-containing protein